MTKGNSYQLGQSDSLFKKMSVISAIILIIILIFNYISGNQIPFSKTTKSLASTTAAGSMGELKRSFTEEDTLTSQLADQYFHSDSDDHESEVFLSENQGDEPDEFQINKTSNSNTGDLFEDQAQLIHEENNEEESSALASSKVSNMIEILEYEKLKTFLRKLSMTTLKKLRKLMAVNPDEGQRYLVRLANRHNNNYRTKGFGPEESNNFLIKNKDLVKIATVIFEPEFLDMADFQENDETDSSRSTENYDSTQPNGFKNSINFDQFSNYRPDKPNSFTVSKGKSKRRQKTPLQLIKANVRNAYRRGLHSHLNPAKSKFNTNKFKSSYRPPSQQTITSLNSILVPPFQFSSPEPSSDIDTLLEHSDSHASSFPSDNLRLVNYNYHKSNRNRKIKPVVEFFSRKDKIFESNLTAEASTMLEGNHRRNPVSFYISSILAADSNKKQQRYGHLLQQPEEYLNGNLDDKNRNHWENGGKGPTKFGSPMIHAPSNLDPLEYAGTFLSATNLLPTTNENSDEDDSTSISNNNNPALSAQYFSPLAHQDSPVVISDGFSQNSLQNTKGIINSNNFNNGGITSTVNGQSPYDNKYIQYIGGGGGGINKNQLSSPISSSYNNFVVPQMAQIYTNSNKGIVNSHPFAYYGPGELSLSLNHYGENYPSINNNIENWFDSFKSVFNGFGSGYYSTSAGTRKILEISISILAFLAFGSYIATLLLRTLAPSLLNPFYYTNTRNNGTTVITRPLFGRSLILQHYEGYEDYDDSGSQNGQESAQIKTNSTVAMVQEHQLPFIHELEERIKLGIEKFINDFGT